MKQFLSPLFFALSLLILTACGGGGDGTDATTTTTGTTAFPTMASLGESLFSDKNLSLTRNQSCASCHDLDNAFIDIRDNGVSKAVSVGDDNISFGTRNASTVAYTRFSPNFSGTNENATGGQFLDGRAVDFAAQAEGPPVNPVEMNMASTADVVSRIQENADYVAAFESFFGSTVFDNTDAAYSAMGTSIEAFEETDTFAPFDSKYDRAIAGTYTMTTPESDGQNLFFSNVVSCRRCHRTQNLPPRSASEIFTRFEYFNVGVPANVVLNAHFVSVGQQTDLTTNGDQGLFNNPAVNNDANTRGLFKIPTLRNIAVTAPYMHNGVFANLQTVLHFYDHQGGNPARDNNPETGVAWNTSEITTTVNTQRLRMRDLTDDELDDLECFLRTLTDAKFETILPPLRTGLSCS